MNVRSAMLAMLALALCGFAAAPAVAGAQAVATGPDAPRVTLAMLPPGTEIGAIADAVPGIAPGVMSGGLGRVPASQTYLDITQGNRLFTSLYPETLTPLYVTGNRVPADLWDKVVDHWARPLCASTTWNLWISSRCGLWLTSRMSQSPRVPTVE